MPEEIVIGTNLKSALDNLEFYELENRLSRHQDYDIVLKALKNEENLSLKDTERLLAICVHDLKESFNNTTVINVISVIISRVKMGTYNKSPDLVPSALALIHTIKTTALLSRVESLKNLCYATLLSCPDETLINLVEHHEEIMEIFNLYCHLNIPIMLRTMACNLLHKLLKILPSEKKKVFIVKGIAVWFSKIIPSIMVDFVNTENGEIYMEILEMLTEYLVDCDYTEEKEWHSLLECICASKKYPLVMKCLLQSGNGLWHRLWIVFIKLLKHQVTQSLGAIGTPINSMLPVVETAFKLDINNRCKAFECWNVLIDSFSTETNESNINKRIKLLIIPLKSNNAKAEATALAKFSCWWHLIGKFQNKIDKFLDIVLVSFLHFCFGRHNCSDNTVLVPGQISLELKKLCVQAIVEMVGHVHCDGCTSLPKLNGKMITTKHLVDNWNHWIYSLTSAIMMTASNDDGLTKQQMSCLWKSFLFTIGELPENNIRKDLFTEMLAILVRLVQKSKANAKLADYVFSVLLPSLFDEDSRIKTLLKSKNEAEGPLYKIIKVLLDPSLIVAYQGCSITTLQTKLNPITRTLMNSTVCSPNYVIGWLLPILPRTDFGLALWNTLLESVCELQYDIHPHALSSILMWPLKSVNVFSDVKPSAMLWYKTYDLLHLKLKKSDLYLEVSEYLFTEKELSNSTTYFKLCIILAILKSKRAEDQCAKCEKEMGILHNLTNQIDSYQSYEQLFPILIDNILATINIIMTHENETVACHILVCLKKTITVMVQACTQQSKVSPHILIFIEKLLKPLLTLFEVKLYSKLILMVVDDILELSSFLSAQSLTKSTILSLLKTFSTKIVETDTLFNKIKAQIDKIENVAKSPESLISEKNKFTTPKVKEVKRTKKKEPSIVNTVVENGEEYVVVKSNWKFNPRKLTENQKEKLQRKREDIPALYQDLSQSQDEFKLTSWKTDSQDTSNSSKSESKSLQSGSNETNTEILKNLQSSNVVPKILENFFSENEKKDSPKSTNDSKNTPKNNLSKLEPTTPKNSKSPRMALKDRVFRNVRNLIEKSGELQNEKIVVSEDLNKTVNIIKTPTQSKSADIVNVVNSAPPLLSADRPSRVKRKPKKFDELHLLSAKKCRKSLLEKAATKTEQSTIAKSPSTTNKDVHVIEDSAPIISLTNDEDENPHEGVQVPENIIIPGSNDVVEEDKNIEKTESEIDEIQKTLNKSSKIKTIEVKCKDNLNTNLDKNTRIGDCIEEDSSNQRVENLSEQNDKKSLGKKAKSKIQNFYHSIDSKDKLPDGKKDELTDKDAEKVNDLNNDIIIIDDENANNNNNDHEPAGKNGEKSIDKKDHTVSKDELFDKNEEKLDSKDDITEKKDVPSDNNVEKSDKKDEKSGINEDEGKVPENKVDNKEITTVVNPVTPELKEVSTPQQLSKTKGTEEQKSTTKKNSVRKSRIEKELAIDTVEGHPFLKMQSQKRLTRKALESAAGPGRRKSLFEKLNKSKSEANISVAKLDKKTKDKNRDSDGSNTSVTVEESQEKDSAARDDKSETRDERSEGSVSEDLPFSDDVIESSQDSNITTISATSAKKKNLKKVPIVSVQKMKLIVDKVQDINESQSILDCVVVGVTESISGANQESKDDIELPVNKTVVEEKTQDDLTENMDTEPIDEKELSEVVIIINDDVQPPLTISSDESVGPETQEVAEADTQPNDPKDFMDIDLPQVTITAIVKEHPTNINQTSTNRNTMAKEILRSENTMNSLDNTTVTLSESACVELEKENGASSPSSLGDEAQRKQDFLNNTIEISPIKNMSPDRNKKSPSPETSSDYVVIKLSSPVHSNGEPFEKCGSPEVFTEDKISPDKRDQSPPRAEVTVTNSSPSSSLSLKKNRPQVRPGGRGAQMLGLCVPDKMQAIINQEKNDSEEVKKTSSSSTPARRNLRILYNSASDVTESTSENDDSENFLKFRKSLPAVDCSPSGPILKRKLIEICDDATISPASKRKRVSFHDPPVSTTVSVQKYIEPAGVRSPQNSAQKRLERQLRQHTPLKSPKRLDHAFKLDTVLTKAIESFSESEVIATPDDTQGLSLDETPVVEIVRASELNDIDPICPELIDCKDPIDNIAAELSSSAMKSLLVNELVGKVETVGDLAKMTELEVNRLCIKAPKVKVTKKVLSDYVSKRVDKPSGDLTVTINESAFDEPMVEPEPKGIDMEMQTDKHETSETEMQTDVTATAITCVQTDTIPTAHTSVQTDESGSKSTADIIKLCLAERPDFVKQVGEQLEESLIKQITDKLPFNAITDVLMDKITPSNSKTMLTRILEHPSNSPDSVRSKELSFIRDYLCERFESKDLILFCSEILKSVYDKPV